MVRACLPQLPPHEQALRLGADLADLEGGTPADVRATACGNFVRSGGPDVLLGMSRPGFGAVRGVFGHSGPELSVWTCLGRCCVVSPHARVSPSPWKGWRWERVCRHAHLVRCRAHTVYVCWDYAR
eukprot:10597268-Heterocapsa_arctica.AAC.1